jgi:hypothetical protein
MSVLRDMSWFVVLVVVVGLALVGVSLAGNVHHAPNVANVTARSVAHNANYCASLSSVHGQTIRTIYPC